MAFSAAVVAGMWSPAALAQSVSAALPSAPTISESSLSASLTVPAGTIVEVELVDALSSARNHQQELFAIRLASPLIFEGREIAPAGAIGGGEVIDTAPSGIGGRQGRLIVSVRYLEILGQRVRIRGLQWTGAGESRAGAAIGLSLVPVAGLASIFLHGGEIELPAGTRGQARLAEDVTFPANAAGPAPNN